MLATVNKHVSCRDGFLEYMDS